MASKRKPPISKPSADALLVEETLTYDPAWREARWRSELRKSLLRWFGDHARVLPWRSEPTPYRVWVSEVMLQQTQVSTVLPYFDRFMARIPDVATLASIDEAELMRLWEGLGYYRRARSMQAAAKKIVAEHGGVFPQDFESVLGLPGIGRYTAGAILSISGDARYPVLEGNTQRVYSRWIGLRDSPTVPAANRLLWTFAEAMLPRDGSGTFNQAAMELGALICTPRTPRCDECPVRSRCAAAALGEQATIPGKLAKLKYEDRTEFAFVVAESGAGKASSESENDPSPVRYLVREIPAGRRWMGLWDFPRTSEQPLESIEQAVEWMEKAEGLKLVPSARLMTIKHAVTRYRITLHVHVAELAGKRGRNALTSIPSGWRFAAPGELAEFAMNASGRRIVENLAALERRERPER